MCCLGRRGAPELPEAYRTAAVVLRLAEAGIGPAEAEAMDPYLLAAVLDILTAQGIAQGQERAEREAAGGA